MMAWIYDYDWEDFEFYCEARPAQALLSHTVRGEVILHLADDGQLSVIENQAIKPWPPGHTLEVGLRVFARERFAPSVTIGLLAPGHA
jgi:hypothetical protein